MIRYYTLLTIGNDGKWHPQFGDYDTEVVEREREDEYADELTIIITTQDNQDAVDQRVFELNQKH